MPRPVDLVLALLLGMLALPLLLAVALAVRLSSAGPVLYRQVRTGRHGRPFVLLKFRTMQVGADAAGRLTIGSDARVTPVGGFLRAHRLDELPQLLNVVRGDMAVVGARPEVPEFVGGSDAQRRLLLRRPGLTDPASLRYVDEACVLAAQADPEDFYRTVLLPRKVQLSLDYALVRTARSDLGVLVRTAAVVLLPRTRS